ncbi:AI-2E family transporter [Raoultella ornithinolytica]|jgi:predicted PurR-regulated permease PerM|uniref:AI-2E family transporter n=1 Tax=Raoultella ornithinolytica TaxID=54291 RepID=UPI0010A3D31A|nr:AI-2E family transporter [Raoultella ornithinolytica]KAB8157930.1 AI-2E family transporter [Raoultella ornithinolytica]KAB8170689.1 AI-2E family transporter [Raoultella ornithinolytica]MBM6477988.1 AI-2E family transporter [Raoultella ornithinolytica]MCF6655993.1 AI-2E family transporter [Raoultella ornithinolytica]MCF6704132.1 AI-2E family transporter [Raoultella ornithinolytica]
MENNNLLVVEKRLVARFLDMFIRFGLILALASFCYTVFSPFLNMMLWAVILAVTLYPLHQYFAARLGGKQGWSSTLIVLLGIVLIVVPTVLMISSLGESVSVMIDKLSGRAFVIPPPSAHIATIPIVGEKISVLWLKASNDLPGLISNYRTQIGDIAKATLGILASMGGGLLGFILSFIVAGIIMTWGAAGADSARRIAIRLTDENKGQSLVKLCTSTIRAVAQGVIGVALIQALLVGVIMIVAGIPAVGIFFILALILGIAQIPVILVTAPAIALMWSLGDHGTAMNIVYTILLIVAGMADNVLKPLMLGRGVDAPMPVVLLGALGGMAASGILGMFIGATLLSIGYRIFMSWVNDGQVGDSQTPVVPDDKDAQ